MCASMNQSMCDLYLRGGTVNFSSERRGAPLF